ncbi:unnamed protein product (macronuclear) [Paramecium tetraurelia]|uniref:Uncharacterized protein n=1 Tax=Paramecium tetraurelia TaxID=5888 RepID=A0BAW6_PARTE|nr:uncharacterized protein GSPATT00000118001 [Paramecium tetraurelia]CAK55683.1 unnamed protein product [Paramecium tetraurelia]|eukprot:XP_001423081.1 hypothetical protein (macronuclear) [Paramecium tetraurelia strain d4-2]
MQLCPQVDDNEPIVLGNVSEEWQFFLEAWKHIPIKYYSLQVGNCYILIPKREGKYASSNINIRIILSILSKDEGMYVKFTITPPSTPCKINVKFVIEDIITQLPVEGIEMEINVKNF